MDWINLVHARDCCQFSYNVCKFLSVRATSGLSETTKLHGVIFCYDDIYASLLLSAYKYMTGFDRCTERF
jgi:hypothetical protein